MKHLPAPLPQENKTDWIRAAVTPDDRQILKQYAADNNISESAAIRFILQFFFKSGFENSKAHIETVNNNLEVAE